MHLARPSSRSGRGHIAVFTALRLLGCRGPSHLSDSSSTRRGGGADRPARSAALRQRYGVSARSAFYGVQCRRPSWLVVAAEEPRRDWEAVRRPAEVRHWHPIRRMSRSPRCSPPPRGTSAAYVFRGRPPPGGRPGCTPHDPLIGTSRDPAVRSSSPGLRLRARCYYCGLQLNDYGVLPRSYRPTGS